MSIRIPIRFYLIGIFLNLKMQVRKRRVRKKHPLKQQRLIYRIRKIRMRLLNKKKKSNLNTSKLTKITFIDNKKT